MGPLQVQGRLGFGVFAESALWWISDPPFNAGDNEAHLGKLRIQRVEPLEGGRLLPSWFAKLASPRATTVCIPKNHWK